jgi:hypothetical protein
MNLDTKYQEIEAHLINNEIDAAKNALKPFSEPDISYTASSLKAIEATKRVLPVKSKDTLDYENSLNTRNSHVGTSNYSTKKIQPRDIWKEYQMNPWDADIVKRLLRVKVIEGMTADQARIEDYEKMIHICRMRIEDIEEGNLYYREN